MGFCRYCGEISLGKCSRCGGRSVESTISSMFSDSSISIIDRWQSQYEDTILITKELLNKNTTSKRIPVTQSTFYDTVRKACACCSKVLDHKTAAVIESGKTYCQDCHVKLYNKGECSSCHKFILASQKFIEYGKGVWHADCFTCFNCKKPLDKDPLVDLENRPCCEPCFMKQAGTRKNDVARAPMTLIPKPTQSVLNIKHRQDFTPLASKSTSNLNSNTQIKRIPTPPARASLSSRPCHYCHRPLGDVSQKKVRMETDSQESVWFHKACFLCSKCHKPFKDGQCATDGKSFYHPQCEEQCASCDKVIQTDAFIFNHKKYHFKCFKCFASGCQINLGDPVFEVNSKPFCQSCYQFTLLPTSPPSNPKKEEHHPRPRSHVLSKLGGFNTCPRCKKSISVMDDTQGPFASHWHKKCLCCAKCSKQLDSGAKLRQGSQQESLVYCRNCIV